MLDDISDEELISHYQNARTKKQFYEIGKYAGLRSYLGVDIDQLIEENQRIMTTIGGELHLRTISINQTSYPT